MQFLHDLRRHAELRREQPALIERGRITSYGDLWAHVERRALAISRYDVATGRRVVLVADNAGAYLEAAFAVWLLGATLVTVYPSSGDEELLYVVTNAEADLVIGDQRATPRLSALGLGVPVVALDALDGDQPSFGKLARPTDAEALALICYTSGSTSRPKAVMHSASGLSAAATAYADVWHLGPVDRTIVCLPMAWAFGLVTTSMATLHAGGTVLPLARSKSELLVDALTRDRATFLAGVTTTFVKLLDDLPLEPAPFPALRLCISGGEPRNERAFDEWRARTDVPVHDVFAASECFPVITYDPHLDPSPIRGSAGRVVPGAAMRVVDETGREVVQGSAGEALWRGPALFVGYWGDAAATEAALLDGWYRTKDLVRVDADGYVFVLGRLSDMIIRGGSNVSPAEVEDVIRSSDAVSAVAVVGLPDPVYGQRVVAAVTLRPRAELDVTALRELCTQRLAGYKVPTEIVEVTQLATNARTGKIDRRAVAARLEEAEAALA